VNMLDGGPVGVCRASCKSAEVPHSQDKVGPSAERGVWQQANSLQVPPFEFRLRFGIGGHQLKARLHGPLLGAALSHVEARKDVLEVGLLAEEDLAQGTTLDLDDQDELRFSEIADTKLAVKRGFDTVNFSLGQRRKQQVVNLESTVVPAGLILAAVDAVVRDSRSIAKFAKGGVNFVIPDLFSSPETLGDLWSLRTLP
jgi:hypothetical protein